MYEKNMETSGWGQAPIFEKNHVQSLQCSGIIRVVISFSVYN